MPVSCGNVIYTDGCSSCGSSSAVGAGCPAGGCGGVIVEEATEASTQVEAPVEETAPEAAPEESGREA